MFTPIYIANYCENYCIYCGFNCHNKIHRARLTPEEIDKEMAAIAATGVTATASVSTFARIGVRCRRLVVRVWRAANRADALAERMIVCKLAR